MRHKRVLFYVLMLTLIGGCADSGRSTSDIESMLQQMSEIERGRYVVVIMGCNDCHTPGYLVKRTNIPEDDWLVGNPLGFLGPRGTHYPTNLRRLLNELPEEDWLVLAKQMRKESPMADVMLPETLEQDLRAIYRFIRYLGPKGEPAPERLPQGIIPTTPYIEIPYSH